MPIKVRAFPVADATFVQEVLESCRTVIPATDSPEDLGPALERSLRAHYPNATIRIQDPLALVGTTVPTVYAFRDRALRPQDARRERLYSTLARARETIRASRRARERSEQLLLDLDLPSPSPDLNRSTRRGPRP